MPLQKPMYYHHWFRQTLLLGAEKSFAYSKNKITSFFLPNPRDPFTHSPKADMNPRLCSRTCMDDTLVGCMT